MKMDHNTISIYDGIEKSASKYSRINHKAIFDFSEGATVRFYSKVPGSSCLVKMTDINSGEIHYSTRIYDNMFAKSNREYISDLQIEAVDNEGNLLLDISLKEWDKSRS